MASKRLLPYRQSLGAVLLEAHEAAMMPIRPVLRAHDITEAQWRVLRVMGDQEEIDAARLAEAALLHPPSVSRILREMTERKLIVRRTDPVDGRRAILVLSPDGRKIADGIASLAIQVIDAYGRCYGVERLASLRRELAAFSAAVDGITVSSDGIGGSKD